MSSYLRLAVEALPNPGTRGSWAQRLAEGLTELNGAVKGELDGKGPWLGQLWRALEPRPDYPGTVWSQKLVGGSMRDLWQAIVNGGGGGWTPSDLGDLLKAWWDAEDVDSLTLVGGLASAWVDQVGGYSVTQALGGQMPVYSATSFGGRPGLTFDGLDDFLAIAPAPASIPVGEDPCEIWALVDQTALNSAAGQRQIVTYGSATNDRRMIYRDVASAENRFRVVGTRSTNGVVASQNTIPFFGRHVVRGIFNGTQIIAEIDGVQGSPTALLPLTTNARLRIGASPLSAANAFFQGVMSMSAITGTLDGDQATQMYSFMAARISA